jgi:hypothetical protein
MKAHVRYASWDDIDKFEEMEFKTLEELREWQKGIKEDIVIWNNKFTTIPYDLHITVYDSYLE